MHQPPFDLARAHRWFAVELNNLAWSFIECTTRTAQETDRMLHAAHASYYHWLEAGLPINELRAACLLSTAYTAAKLAEPAVRYAERSLALADQHPEGLTPFDLATLRGAAAHAFLLAGQADRADTEYAAATTAIKQCSADDERELFARLYPTPTRDRR